MTRELRIVVFVAMGLFAGSAAAGDLCSLGARADLKSEHELIGGFATVVGPQEIKVSRLWLAVAEWANFDITNSDHVVWRLGVNGNFTDIYAVDIASEWQTAADLDDEGYAELTFQWPKNALSCTLNSIGLYDSSNDKVIGWGQFN